MSDPLSDAAQVELWKARAISWAAMYRTERDRADAAEKKLAELINAPTPA